MIRRASLALLLCCLSGFAAASGARVFEFEYEVLTAQFPSDQAVDIYIPVPTAQPGQVILDETLQSQPKGKTGIERQHGNTFYHIHRPAGDATPLSASLKWVVSRDLVTASGSADVNAQLQEKFLGPNRLVPVGHEILDPIRSEIHAQRLSDSPEDTARAIYDWVVDNVEYKKVGTGWGNGDTFWACNERYGNCTDFHALFISLARTEGIPARFEIGFPVPSDRNQGQIGGYHCWVQFYLPERGWVPIDASEAAKAPQKRELFYGSHPADRIHFTTGRDLVLSEGSAAAPLNYFVYPYVEVGGKPWQGKLPTRFSFSDVSGAALSSIRLMQNNE
jgi:transglutaminase-like putative cysteine protease